MSTTLKNPYVGPRTFRREDGDFFFGREREARDLMALASSERLVLFYAQSGAGKSSLLNTRLLPELERSHFEVLPVGRLQGEGPAGLAVDNIYLYNLMSSMVQQKFSPEALVGLSFSQFLAILEFQDGGYLLGEESLNDIIQEARWRRVLIIDQFEEIFTSHLAFWNKRDEFFRQLAQTLQDDPYLTIILIMREDYVASLDPYAHLLPGGLRMRYYMQRLSQEAALKAVKNPAEGSRPYAEGVAEKLVDDLASITVYKPDGTHEMQRGQYIEPVQLQVVCYGLWEDLPSDRDTITADDLLEVGDVDQSLERFFDRRMAAVAQTMSVPERNIREWFEKELITSNRTRNMVLRDTSDTAMLHDNVVRTMRGDLVKAELRAGQIWYELSHDRLIKPIITSNAKWFDVHLSKFQQRVVLWGVEGKSESLLLRDRELIDAENEASTLTLTSDEQEFLEECRALQKRIQRDRTQTRVIFGALIVSVILLIAAIFSTINANAAKQEANNQASIANTAQVNAITQKNAAATAQVYAESNANAAATAKAEAESQASKALAGSLVAQADALKNSDHGLALLLGMEAYNRNPGDLTKSLLFNLFQFTAYKKVNDFYGVVNSAAVSPDGKWIAMASCTRDACNKQGEIRLFREAIDKPVDAVGGQYGIIYSLAFYQYSDKLILAAGGCDPEGCSINRGQISLWEISDTGAATLLSKTRAHSNLVKTIKFSPDGKLLASGSYDTTILLWDLTDPKNLRDLGARLDHPSFVNDIAFNPDGNYLVSAGDDRTIYVWDISQKDHIGNQPFNKYDQVYTAPVTSVAFSPDGKTLASAGNDSLVRLWDWNAGSLSPRNTTLTGHAGYVTSVAFISDESLASAGFDNQLFVWNISTATPIGPALNVHTKAINRVVFGSFSGKPFLISVGNDRTAIQWDLSTRNPLGPFPDFSDPGNQALISHASDWSVRACSTVKRNLTQTEWDTYLPGQPYNKTCPEFP